MLDSWKIRLRKIRPRKIRPPLGLSKINIENLGKIGKFTLRPQEKTLEKTVFLNVLNFTNKTQILFGEKKGLKIAILKFKSILS